MRPGRNNIRVVLCPGAWGLTYRGPMHLFECVLLLFSLILLLEHILLIQTLDFLRLCLRVLRGRKGKAKEGKGREGRKKGKPSPCLGVKETNKERRWRAYVINLLIYHFFLLK